MQVCFCGHSCLSNPFSTIVVLSFFSFVFLLNFQHNQLKAKDFNNVRYDKISLFLSYQSKNFVRKMLFVCFSLGKDLSSLSFRQNLSSMKDFSTFCRIGHDLSSLSFRQNLSSMKDFSTFCRIGQDLGSFFDCLCFFFVVRVLDVSHKKVPVV